MNSVFANRQTISKQILHQDVKVVVVMCEVFLPTNTQTRAATVCLCVVAAVLSGGGSLRQTQAADTSQAGM